MKKIYATPLRLIMAIAVIFNMAYLISCKDDEAAPVPVAAFDYETTSELEFGLPLDVQFMDKSTQTDANTTYLWDFGDGSTSTEKSPAHTYSSGGSYTVKFTLKNAEGKANDHSKDIELTSAIVGTWKLDSVAVSSVDSFATKYEIKTAIEFGNHEGWDGSKWMSVGDDGYSTFWSNVIFKGNYLGRKSFFAVEYNFTADGKFTRDEKGKLPAAVYFPEERDYLETEEWVNTEGASLADWKSGEYSWGMKESASYAGRTDLVIDGKKGGFLGLYFAGSESQVPGDSYIYTVSQVNNNQLIVSGVSNLFGNADNLFILKFKKVQ